VTQDNTQSQFSAISRTIGEYGPGGMAVLETARDALLKSHAAGKAPLVELADLWAESLQEGRGLFDKPDRLWGVTPAAETLDMIGQTTVGPWQLTDWNIRDHYGPPYGVKKEWTTRELVQFCRGNPGIQALMISDYIQEAYALLGRRSPGGIQKYFWLEAWLKGDIGLGAWDEPVLVLPDETGKWEVTPEKMKRTGFYAKQIVLGHRGNPHGLLYWLWVAGDAEGIIRTLAAWRDARRWVWDEGGKKPVETAEPGGMAIAPEDVKFCDCHPKFRDMVRDLARKVLAGG